MQYTIFRPSNQQQYGPVDLATLQSWARKGQIDPEDQVCGGASQDWVQASMHPDVAPHLGVVPSKPTVAVPPPRVAKILSPPRIVQPTQFSHVPSHPNEVPRLLMTVAVAVAAILLLAFGIVKMEDADSLITDISLFSKLGQVLLSYAALTGMFWFSIRMMLSNVTLHAVRVNERQFPEIWTRYIEVCRRLGADNPPPLYVLHDESVNAFAARLAHRRMVVLHSKLLHRLDGDNEALDFVMGHEVGHILANHAKNPLMIALLPFSQTQFFFLLINALKRAQEFTADRYGLVGCGSVAGAERALRQLALGRFGTAISMAELERQHLMERDVFHWMIEITLTHPSFLKRFEQVHSFAQASGMSAAPSA